MVSTANATSAKVISLKTLSRLSLSLSPYLYLFPRLHILLSFSPFLSLFLSLSEPQTHTHTHTRTHTQDGEARLTKPSNEDEGHRRFALCRSLLIRQARRNDASP